MQKMTLLEKYPVFSTTIKESECKFATTDEVIAHFKAKIEADKGAKYIAVFDQYAHTSSLEGGEIAPSILDAKIIIFCFGPKIPNPQILAVRPRSIGVSKTTEGFAISFMDAPMPIINEKITAWIDEVKR